MTSADERSIGVPSERTSTLIRLLQRLRIVGARPGRFWLKTMEAPFFFAVLLLAAVVVMVCVIALIVATL